jgi:2-polyprenyl-3-methyl-5-hydroxy-6-metoxy-1,4-benzoquinol methylase
LKPRDFYEGGQQRYPSVQDSHRLAKVARLARKYASGARRILDIGCGDGSRLAYLRETRSIEPYGIEVSQKACELARKKGIQVVQADVTADGWAIPEQVGYITASEVLEHLPSPERLLLRPRGLYRRRLLIDVPNTGALNERLRLLLGRTPKQWGFHAGEHLRF